MADSRVAVRTPRLSACRTRLIGWCVEEGIPMRVLRPDK
jgi:hypothetical protein